MRYWNKIDSRNHYFFGEGSPSFHTHAGAEDTQRLAHKRVVHPRAHRCHITHTIATEDVGERRSGWIHGLRQKSIRRIQRCQPYPQQYLPRARLWILHLAQA